MSPRAHGPLAALAIAACAAALALPATARATASVDLVAEPLSAQPGEIVRVIYTVHIRGERHAEPQPLDFGALEVLGDSSPPQVPMMWGGGFMMSIDTSHEYAVRAPAPGRYVIGNARIVDAQSGRVIGQHPGVTIVVGAAAGGTTVGDGGASVSYAPPPPQDPDMPPAGDLTGAEYNPRAFVRVALDAPEPYLGQQVILRAWLYVATPEANCEVAREPGLTGFWQESVVPVTRECASRWFSPQNVAGRYMSVGLVRKIALFPSQTGTLTIGPMVVNVEMVTGGMFRQLARVEARSPALTVTVREPPPAGRPASYVPGTTGPVTLGVEVDRGELSVGETALVTVRAQSEGSLASAVIAPPANIDGVRVRAGVTRATHDASTGRVVTTLVTELLVVPERPGRFELGQVELPYWDPAAQRYDVARVTLPALTATGAALAREGADRTPDPALQLRPMTEGPSLTRRRALFSRGPLALFLIALPPLGLLVAAASAAAARRAVRDARGRADARRADPGAILDDARAALKRGDRAGAVSLAGRAFDRAVAAAREQVEGGVTAMEPEVRGVVDDARQACEAARFAGEDVDAGDLIGRVERAVRALEEAA